MPEPRLVLALLAGAAAIAGASARQPSVLFVLADDLGFGEMGWQRGEARSPTPFLDELAAGGVVLDGHVSHGICVPSRAALMTGRKPYTLGMDASAKALPLDADLLSNRLKRLGYATSMVGKWHLGGLHEPQYLPTRRGFDEFFGILSAAADPWLFTHKVHEEGLETRYMLLRNEEPALTEDGAYYREFSTELYVNETLRMLSEVPAGTPFFHYFAMQMVHAPFRYGPDFPDTSKPPLDSMVRQVDASMRRLMDGIAELGLDSNLVTVFVSDNGGQITMGGQASNKPLNGGKWTVHEGGIKTPAIVSSPLLGASRGRRTSEFVAIEDWLPTLVSLAGGSVGSTVQGFDIWPVIADQAPTPRKTWVSILDLSGMDNPPRTVRSRRYKYIQDAYVLAGGDCTTPHPPEEGTPEEDFEAVDICVFDLEEDPEEMAPLTAEHPKYNIVVEEARAILNTQIGLIPVNDTLEPHPDWWARRFAYRRAPPGEDVPPVTISPLTARMPASTDPDLVEDPSGRIFNATWVPPCFDGVDARDGAPCNATELSTTRTSPRSFSITTHVYDWIRHAPVSGAHMDVRVVLGTGFQTRSTLQSDADGVVTVQFQTGATGIQFCRERIHGGGGLWDANDLVSCFVFEHQ